MRRASSFGIESLNVPEGGESRKVSLLTTAGAEYVAPTAVWRADSSLLSSLSDASFLASNDQRWPSSGTNNVGPAAAATLGGGSWACQPACDRRGRSYDALVTTVLAYV